MITTHQIKRLFPAAKPDLVSAIAANWSQAERAGITTRKRKAMFLAMVGVETGGLRAIVENLNYTTAARIRATWPKRFATDASAKPYVKQPTKLANFVYANRLDNGPPASGDGYRFRGRGMMQTTGRVNYAARGFEDNPEALQDPATAFLTAVAEWKRRGCNAFADGGKIKECRKAINGGDNGLAEAVGYYAKGLEIFADDKGAMPKAAPLAFAELPADAADEKMPGIEEELDAALDEPAAASQPVVQMVATPRPDLVGRPSAVVERILRDEGSRTIQKANEVIKKSLVNRAAALIPGGGFASIFLGLGNVPLWVWIVGGISLVAIGVILFLSWRQSHEATAIKVARVDDAVTGNASYGGPLRPAAAVTIVPAGQP